MTNKPNTPTFQQEFKKVVDQLRDPYNQMKMKNRTISVLLSILRFLLLFALMFVILFPIFQQLSLAFRDPSELNDPTVIWVPKNWSMLNIEIAMDILKFQESLINSLILSAIVMVLQVLVTSITGYAFARLQFRGSNLLFLLVVITIIMPPQTLSIPRQLFFQNFDILAGPISWITKKPGGIITRIFGAPFNLLSPERSWYSLFIMTGLGMGLNSGIFIFIFRQFFKNIPKELDESAEVDGASVIRTFWSVVLPNARPAMLTVGLFAFVWQYNDVYYARLLKLSPEETNPLISVKLSAAAENIRQALLYAGANVRVGTHIYNNPYYVNLIANTAAVLMMLPILFLFILLQRHFVEGIERTGIVG